MEILFILLVLLVITRAFGEFAARLGQPAIVGELLSGITLGIVIQFSLDLFPIMKNINDNEVFTSLTDLGIFSLLPTARCVMGHAGRFIYVDRSSELGRI